MIVIWAERQTESRDFAMAAGLKRGEVKLIGNHAFPQSFDGLQPTAVILLPGADDGSHSASCIRSVLEHASVKAPGPVPWLDLRVVLDR